MIFFYIMKRYLFLLLAACLFATVSVSHAQDQPPQEKPAIIAIENHHITLPEVPASFETTIKPECQVQAFAETVQPATLPATCAADADYGSCMDNKLFSTYNELRSSILKQNRFTFLAIKPKTHSSGGMPFMRA